MALSQEQIDLINIQLTELQKQKSDLEIEINPLERVIIDQVNRLNSKKADLESVNSRIAAFELLKNG